MSEKTIIYFKDLADDWIIQKRITVKNSTYVKYKNVLEKHILPEFGDIALETLDNHRIIDFINTKMTLTEDSTRPPLANKTVKDILLIFNNILKYGEIYYPKQIPTIKIVYPTIVQNEIRILSKIEQCTLEKILYQNMDNIKLGILLCLYTGLRIGEICGLRWEDISLCDGTISVKRTVQRLQTFSNNGGAKTRLSIDTPKTGNSQRKIPIPEFLLPMLNDFYPSCSSCFILTNEQNSCMEPRTLENHFYGFIRSVNEQCKDNPQYISPNGKLTFHSLRHTFATRCVEAGFEIKCLSEILGHANVNITLNRYVHSSIQMKRDNMKKLSSPYQASKIS